MVADRAVMHFKETPADTPIFAMLSIYDLHGPNTPMPGYLGDPRCANIPPWDPPNYNEADLSPTSHWPSRVCRSSLTRTAGRW